MDVILKQAVEGLGKPGDIVKVTIGHARNFLFPRKLAVEATPQNLRIHQKQLKQKAMEQDQRDSQRLKLAELINGLACVIQRQAGDDGKLFGSVSHVDILHFLNDNQIEIDKGQISLDKPIKSLGNHEIGIKLGRGVEATLKITVEKQIKS
ncbi:MAG: 50S ribosomal protein L9 [bacterium]